MALRFFMAVDDSRMAFQMQTHHLFCAYHYQSVRLSCSASICQVIHWMDLIGVAPLHLLDPLNQDNI